MADSNITKKALASALKILMQQKPFDKISVGDICEQCDMNRKSFYYHFRDKYDLVNWIFDTEFITASAKNQCIEPWEWYTNICKYFYENKSFYRKALKITGQNSFCDHFRETLFAVISNRFEEITGYKNVHQFQCSFFTDAIVMAVQRWLIEDTEMSDVEFIEQTRQCVELVADNYDKLQ